MYHPRPASFPRPEFSPRTNSSVRWWVLLPFALVSASVSSADVLTTKQGLVIEGLVSEVGRADSGQSKPGSSEVSRGGYAITTEHGVIRVEKNNVLSIVRGESPRADWQAAFVKGASDAKELYRLAVGAEARGMKDLAERAYAAVVAIDPQHRAARRALGYELHQGDWKPTNELRRAEGMVMFEGAWRLPAEVEHLMKSRAKITKKSRTPAKSPTTLAKESAAKAYAWLEASALGEIAMRRVADRALASSTTHHDAQAAALKGLMHKEPTMRTASARLLGTLGDEASLKPLILSAARDKDESVRREATLAAMSFGHDDLSIPFVRALGSQNLKVVANAAQALGLIGDVRALGYVVKRMVSAGSSTRNFVAFTNQISYVRDYDVEIAQASNIANPDVGVIQEGTILDAKVAGLYYTKTWIEPILVSAAGALAGERFQNREGVLAWHAKNEASIPAYPPKPGKRIRKKRRGTWIGVPQPQR